MGKNTITHNVRRLLQEHSMLNGVKRMLVAVSGGRDSVALLIVLSELLKADVRLSVGHIHHGLRGKEAEEDLEYV